LTELAAAFHADLQEAPRSTADRLAWLDAVSDRWDTREGRERNQAGELDLSPHQIEVTLAAADALGMRVAAPPTLSRYDHVLVLGGLIRACLTRPAYAAHLLTTGTKAGALWGLGGHRPFAGDEFALAEAAGVPGLTEEYEALDLGVRRAFQLGEPEAEVGESSSSPGGTWGLRTYTSDKVERVGVGAAPSSDPTVRRANTPDTYRWFAEHLAMVSAESTVLAVTTPIYTVAQHVAALRMLALPHGARVETVGNDPALVPPELAQTFSPTKYLLEARSAIRAVRALDAEVPSRN
jgi:hypothetical protein